jgi:hypothetical protein
MIGPEPQDVEKQCQLFRQRFVFFGTLSTGKYKLMTLQLVKLRATVQVPPGN